MFGWSHILIYSETMFTRLLPVVVSVVMSYQCQMTCVYVCAYLSILLHPCECNIRFTSTKPKDRMPEDEVLVNRILHQQGFNNEFISH